TRARLQGALSSTFAGTNRLESAWDAGQLAVDTLPDLRAKIANGFLEHGAVVLAMRMMAGILDPITLRDRVTSMAASLMGDQRAIDLLDWLLEEYGEDSPTRVNLGLHWLALDEPEKASTAVAKGLGKAEDSPEVALRLAYFEQVLGRLGAAEDRLASLVQNADEVGADDWLGEALTQWGNLAFQGNHWDKAVDLFTEVIALRPQDTYAHYALASARYGQGDLAAARKGYERALILDPGFAGAHQGLEALDAVARANVTH
ncbi:MAG: tetratricopeptide repeat protein, partial [Candidatus Sericytochromatia bacterium]|nr:tetratricopeptide repeat protein [Candidatus Sericytochromatia bacterium]